MAVKCTKNYLKCKSSLYKVISRKRDLLEAKPVLFSHFITQSIADKLEEQGITHASEMQYQTYECFENNNHIKILSETGSGKTLAYLLPLLEKERTGYPKILIFTATNELALQVSSVISSISDITHLTLSIGCERSKESFEKILKDLSLEQYLRKQRKPFKKNIDCNIIISTPGIFFNFDFKLRKLLAPDYVVLDEADTLLQGGTEKQMKRFIKEVNSQKSLDTKFIFSAATFPSGGRSPVENWIDENFRRKMSRVESPQFHKVSPTVSEKFIYIPTDDLPQEKVIEIGRYSQKEMLEIYQQNKLLRKNNFEIVIKRKADYLLEFLKDYKYTKALIFTGSKANSLILENYIKELEPASINSETNPAERFDILHSQNQIVLCTDMLARGIDVPEVDLIVQFDFAKNPTDYLHRVGRTGRFGRTGHVLNIVTDADVDLVTKIQNNDDFGVHIVRKSTKSIKI